MAILVTVFLWLTDIYIYMKGQPAHAVAVLMAMHVAIALVTYNLLVHVARVPAGFVCVAGPRPAAGTLATIAVRCP